MLTDEKKEKKQNLLNSFSSIKDYNFHTGKHRIYMLRKTLEHKVKRTSKTVFSYFK